jgi:hypothetical protein
MRAWSLVTIVALGVAACSGGHADRGPRPTNNNPGPNGTSVVNPGPNPTAGAPETVNGTLALVGGRCPLLGPPASPRTYELVLPSGWSVHPNGLSVGGRVVARLGDEVFVTGHPSSQRNTCAPQAFAPGTLVSVIPAR